ncbi:triosephosphate isomerase [Dictyobacter vulcani]|uniref:Triosephosphate isomerase n=1 Tax=Dictyobacter vulcani TaxID=2607529 RepID=A0A5J4KER2_9CHLR|nr:triose-phosphate isomerase [Dictyobacter vulcani]GER87794.1 triosephosphate isomerase [Dictyobacter vulcani]
MTTVRTAIIAGNWKMNLGPQQASRFVAEILPELGKIVQQHSHIMSILCPPAISLAAVHQVMQSVPTPGVELGAQNMYFEDKGAFTGEIAPGMVKELCSAVILGHSERRGYFHETDELVNKKVHAALHYDLLPIVCIGENTDQYESGETQAVIKAQVEQSLAGLNEEQAGKIVIAYEPIWAIGTGKAASATEAGHVIHLIRHIYAEIYGDTAAQAIRILYGGSVTSANIGEFIAHPDIDGGLIGGASIKSDFVEIVRKSAEVINS